MDTTRRLAEFAAGLTFDDLPREVVDKLKLLTLNIVGKALAGAQTPLAPKYAALAAQIGGGGDAATVLVDGRRLSIPAATYANSGFATALDYDDTLHWALIHPGNAGVAAGLAVGEAQRASGRDFLTALVLAYEVGGRIALSMQPGPERFKQVWGLGNQAFAAAPVAGRLLGLDADHMLSTLGITGVYSVVPSAWKYLGPGTRPMREVKMAWGWSAMVGVTAALAAREELRMLQASNIFDGPESYFVMHGADKQEPETLVEGLGERWDVLTTAFKAYPACYLIFGVCDATAAALAGRTLRPADIARIEVSGGEWITKRLSDPDPFGPVDAQFSTQWCVAQMILGVPPGPRWCDDAALAAPDARALARRVDLTFDPVADRMWLEQGKSMNAVTIHLADGTRLHGAVDAPKGEPGNPFTEEEVRQTFRRLAGDVLPAPQVAAIEALVDRLETVDDVGALVRLTLPAAA